MDPAERKGFVETVAGYLLDTWSTEDLQLLLAEEGAWKQFVAAAYMSREKEVCLREALGEIIADPDVEDEDELHHDQQDKTERQEEDALSEALGEVIANTDIEDKEELQSTLWHREQFLRAYPQVKLELEERIGKLRALADKVDKVHRDCTISQVVASSTSAVSGVLTVLGLALAPVTAGVSLALSATGLGLGTAAAVTSVSTTIAEKVNTVSAEAKASKLVPTYKDTMKGIKEVIDQSTHRVLSASTNSIPNIRVIMQNIDAIQLTKASPSLVRNAKSLMTTGKISARSTTQVQKAFEGTALAMSKGARILGAATTGIFLLLDVVNLVEDSKHLHEGAKSESAAELRQQAQDLEEKLQELIQVHDSLIQ